MELKIWAAVLLLTSPLATGTIIAPPNDPPQVDAGLDQTVYVGSTVLLDAGGTRDPDGAVVSYDWRIETPTGDEITPDCPTCERTRFRPTTAGTYAVTLRATDDDGAAGTDTLYVTVEADDGPQVVLDGPDETPNGTSVEFEASPHPGSEPITDIQWRVDGNPIPASNAETLERTFTETGTRTITVTVTDEIGRSNSTSKQVTVTSESTPPLPDGPESNSSTNDSNESDPPDEPVVTPNPGNETAETPDGGSDSGNDGDGSAGDNESDGQTGTPTNETDTRETVNETNSTASKHDPVITGPKIVTGDEPLEATYGLSGLPDENAISEVTWIANGDSVANSASVDAVWTPGDHTLRAVVTYTDGSRDSAYFPDGTTIVEADPAPELTLGQLSVDDRELKGSFDVRDDYENIRTVTVTVDDATIFSGNYPPNVYQAPEQIREDLSYDGLAPNEDYTVTLTATDTRGQTRTTTQRIETDRGPVVISAGFVQDTVDSYHPRIASHRYTAEHVVKIDLNGQSPSNISVNNLREINEILSIGEKQREYNRKSDTLIIITYWAGKSIRDYNISTTVSLHDSVRIYQRESKFSVTSSPPELRVTSPTQGIKRNIKNWGMLVDASRSFDPDGTTLRAQWLQGAESVNGKPFLGKLDSHDVAGVRITDESGSSAEEHGSFLQYYIPRINNASQLSSGPYNETDLVTLEVRTESYAFTKNDNRYNISLDARSNSTGVRIVSVTKEDVPQSELTEYTAVKQRVQRWVTTVEVRADTLNDGENWIEIYNEENPERIYVSEELGEVDIGFSEKKQDVTVEEINYEVENESGREHRQVVERSVYRKLRSDGWELKEEKDVVDSVSIEERHEESYKTVERQTFDSRYAAIRHARLHDSWTYDGVETYESTEQGIKTKWARNLAEGEYTGNTRKVVSNPDATVREREFQYQETKEVTRTTTVRKAVPKQVTRYRTIDRQVCRPKTGCHEWTEQIPYNTVVMVEKVIRKEITEKRQVRHTYWGERARSPAHKATGATRTVRTEPRKYVTEYEVEIPVERTVTRERYVASREIEKTERTWEFSTNVSSLEKARQIARAPNKRISDVTRHTEWVLTKNKTVTEVVENYDDPEAVQTTYATVTGTLVYGPEDGQQRKFTLYMEFDGAVTDEEILEAAIDRDLNCETSEADCDE